jgi:hypothetical protein
VIPSGKTAVAESWSEELWGLRLGECVACIRRRGQYASFHASYEKIGLDISTTKDQGVDKLVAALETFKKEVVLKDNSARYLVRGAYDLSVHAEDRAKIIVVGGGIDNGLPEARKFRVPQIFVVAMDSPDWPPETWGMHLGSAVASLRSGHAVYSDMDMERFASIGLDVSPPKPRTTLQRVVLKES